MRAVQSAVNLETVNCELAETEEKLVSLMGTTADPLPADLPPSSSLDPPTINDRSLPPKNPSSFNFPQPPLSSLASPPPLRPAPPPSRTVHASPCPPRPPLTIQIPPVNLPSSAPTDGQVNFPHSESGNSPEILLINTGDNRGQAAVAATSTKSLFTPTSIHVSRFLMCESVQTGIFINQPRSKAFC